MYLRASTEPAKATYEVRNATGIIEIELGQLRVETTVGGDCDDVRIAGIKGLLAVCLAEYLHLGYGFPLESFHQYEIARRDAVDQLLQGLLLLPAQFVNVSPTLTGRNQHLATPCAAVTVGVLARHVNVKFVMGMLDQRHVQAARGQQWNNAFDQNRLAAAGPAGETKDFHGRSAAEAARRPSYVQTWTLATRAASGLPCDEAQKRWRTSGFVLHDCSKPTALITKPVIIRRRECTDDDLLLTAVLELGA